MSDNTAVYILECVKADLLKVPDKKKDWEHITALEIAIERIKQCNDIKQLVDKWESTRDVPFVENTYSESNRNEKAEYFEQITAIVEFAKYHSNEELEYFLNHLGENDKKE